jgi:hypothetical protein
MCSAATAMSGKEIEGKNKKKEIDREMDRTNRLSLSPLSLYPLKP